MTTENTYRVTIEQWSEAHGKDVQFYVDVQATSEMNAMAKVQNEEDYQYPAARVVAADLKHTTPLVHGELDQLAELHFTKWEE